MASKPSSRQVKFLEEIKHWPIQPGVYVMRDSGQRILYVGKAKNLKNRIRSYFQKASNLSPKTRVLVTKISTLEFTVTNTELEALLLECNLIKKHRPRYNVRLKDDKNFPYFVLDFTHPFPQFRITRKVKLSPELKYFGPYSAGVRDISRFLLKTFQLRDCSDAKFKNRSRPCLSYEIGTCTAPCVDYVSEQDYGAQVREAILFLNGKKSELEKSLKAQMKEASAALKYEQARILRDKLAALKKISAKQDAVLAERQQDIDVIGRHVGTQGDESVVQWVILYIRGGFLTGRKAYRVPLGIDDLETATATFLPQVYSKSLIPDEIWLAEDFPDRKDLESWLSEQAKKKIKIRIGRTEKGIRLLGMAHENAKLIFQERENKNTPQQAGEALQQALGLAEIPLTIEGIDISNLQSQAPVGSLVHFEDGVPIKSRYRLYYPKTVEGQNDFAMIHEVVLRRFQDSENPRPDLLMIDGGKGQLAAAVKALESLEIEVPICSLAKARTERGFHLKQVERSEERVFLPGRKNHVALKANSPGLALLQQIRDEAHRFGVKGHRKRRDKEAMESSPLLTLRGIGKKTKEKLLKEFGDLATILAAPDESLRKLGLNRTQIEQLRGLETNDPGK